MHLAPERIAFKLKLEAELADLFLTNLFASEILSRLPTEDNHLIRCSCLCSFVPR